MVGNISDASLFFNKSSEEAAITEGQKYWNLAEGHRGHYQYVADENRFGVRPLILASLLIYRFGNAKLVTRIGCKIRNPDLAGIIEGHAPRHEQCDLEKSCKSKNACRWTQKYISFSKEITGSPKKIPPNIVTVANKLVSVADRTIPGFEPQIETAYLYVLLRKALATAYVRSGRPLECKALAEKTQNLCDALIGDKPQSMREAYRIIKAHAPEGAAFVGYHAETYKPNRDNGYHVIPLRYREYLSGGNFEHAKNPKGAGGPKKKADQIFQQLSDPNELRLGLIKGHINAGKSAVLVELLRKMENLSEKDTINLELVEKASEDRELPVMVCNVREQSNRDTTIMVLAFLEFLELRKKRAAGKAFKECLEKARTDYSSDTSAHTTEMLQLKIRELHQSSQAFFIFTNWDEHGSSSPRSIMRDQSNANLIHALHDSNAKSRILLSLMANLTKKEEKKFKVDYPPAFFETVKNPRFKQIERYTDNAEYPEAHKEFLDEIEGLMEGKLIPGICLMLMMLLLQLVEGVDSAVRESWTETVHKGIRECAVRIVKTKEAKDRLAETRPLTRLLIDLLYELNLFRISMAIIASDDGLREGSLLKIMRSWHQQTNRKLNRHNTEIEGLKFLETKVRQFFVKPMRPTIHNIHHFDFDEDIGINNAQWEMNHSIREMILGEISAADPKIWKVGQQRVEEYCRTVREAHRLVAKLAFERGQNWRSFSHLSNLTKDWRDLLPDIQSYEGLLASLNPGDFADEDACGIKRAESELLCQKEEDIFSLSNAHHGVTAFRYAINCLLRNRLDYGARLSMVFDKDAMRTRLFLLAFIGIGKKSFKRFHKLHDILPKDRLPLHIRNSLDIAEQLSLLESAALSAFHSQSYEIVLWTWYRFQDILKGYDVNSENRKKYACLGARIACTYFDMSILLGNPAAKTKHSKSQNIAKENHSETLAVLRRFLDKNFSDLKDLDFDVLSEIAEKPLPTMFKPWLRLKCREAELCGLIGDYDEAIKRYEMISRAELLFGENLPPILSGRPARMAIKTYLNSVLLNEETPTRAVKRARLDAVSKLLTTNTGRLSRFGGGEQVGLLIDKALFVAVEWRVGQMETLRPLKKALKIAERAKQIADQGDVSLGMRLQALETHTRIQMEIAERQHAQASLPDDIEEVLLARLKDADLIFRISKVLKFTPMEGIGLFLRAKARYLSKEITDLPPQNFGEESAWDDINTAIAKMDFCGDGSLFSQMESLKKKIGTSNRSY